AVLPVGRGGDLVVVGELQRVDHPQDLVEVAPGAGRIGDDQAHLLVRVDDEQRAYGERVTGVRVDQVVQTGDLAVGIGQDRKVDPGVLGLVDVVDPLDVRVHRVHRQGDGLHAAPGELVLQPGGEAQLGGAHRGEVGRVGKQHAPAVAQPLVKTDATLAGVL